MAKIRFISFYEGDGDPTDPVWSFDLEDTDNPLTEHINTCEIKVSKDGTFTVTLKEQEQ